MGGYLGNFGLGNFWMGYEAVLGRFGGLFGNFGYCEGKVFGVVQSFFPTKTGPPPLPQFSRPMTLLALS